MASRLSVYNAALGFLAERKLASLAENRGPRRKLDSAWDNGFVDFVLEQGLWNFATRTAEISYSPSITPDFGYSRAFDKPSDWIRTVQVSADGMFSDPLDQYLDEQDYWWADLDTIFVRFVSNGNSYGGDLSRWPATFANYAAAQLAFLVADDITDSATKMEAMEKLAKRWLSSAQSKDAMNQAKQFPPYGSWVRARHGRYRRGDRARGNLIG